VSTKNKWTLKTHYPYLLKWGISYAYPAGTLTVQQKKFDRFRFTFNHERPHEALDNETPGSVYVPSARMLPSSVVSFQ
jgi:transposase InsO family protein